ncbi:hypothetical protein Poli38472_007001 [Pythium oligandrum]|uniref:Uncharacterized protein n=1 Tax=Pythium oligandrum TaxID=41045 RepID=A0A8K1C9H7_PYTOL|nr:hypothetical protein Poli38472_007001 [Pythium oligandrum]|eukprot:TMW58856.1 hypothetical protein Poli38472_007001 [Pythium oligandrum]
MFCSIMRFYGLLLTLPYVQQGVLAEGEIKSTFNHIKTACDSPDCISGGCLYDGCSEPLTCRGGLCYFKHCKRAMCDGGACIFDQTETPLCPGGGCRFLNMKTTLGEGYCTGGACTLDDQPHPATFTDSLSE